MKTFFVEIMEAPPSEPFSQGEGKRIVDPMSCCLMLFVEW